MSMVKMLCVVLRCPCGENGGFLSPEIPKQSCQRKISKNCSNEKSKVFHHFFTKVLCQM
jgi:hypothetical protein